MQMIMLIR